MRRTLLFLAVLIGAAKIMTGCGVPTTESKPIYMWVDCEANYERMSYPDSIRYYMERFDGMGIDNVVVDMKSIMGEVLYNSNIAPYMGDWEGVTRDKSYDMLSYFIEEGKRLDINVYASLNVFAGGHNYFDRGVIYNEHPEWQTIVYHEGKLTPISELKWNYNGMMNPSNPEVRDYQISILKEFVEMYPTLKGLILDRVRYDNITSDFSELSRAQFEEYAGYKVKNFPDDILYWETNADGKQQWRQGEGFNKWAEWRAMNIKSFVEEARQEIKSIAPDMEFGDYTGAWYPTYYHVGVNWASKDYDPSLEFDWATPEYKNSGYAELLDIYMTGLYYTLITKEEVDKSNEAVGQRLEAGMDNSRSYWYCIEGGAELVNELVRGAAPVIGSLYVEQYEGDAKQFERALEQTMESTDGVMIFDLVHIINRDWWSALENGLNGSGVEE